MNHDPDTSTTLIAVRQTPPRVVRLNDIKMSRVNSFRLIEILRRADVGFAGYIIKPNART
jgi:hypothetical protein